MRVWTLKNPNKHTLNSFRQLRVCSHVPALCTLVMSVGTRDLFSAWTFHSFMGQAGLSHSAKASFAHFGGLDEAVLSIFSWSFQAAFREVKQGRSGTLCSLPAAPDPGKGWEQGMKGIKVHLHPGRMSQPEMQNFVQQPCREGSEVLTLAGWGHPELPPCHRGVVSISCRSAESSEAVTASCPHPNPLSPARAALSTG